MFERHNHETCASLCGQRSLIFGEIHGLPFAFDNAGADLGSGLALERLFVGVEIFGDADVASGAVFAGKAIEQAAVALAAVAVAVARLAVKGLLDPGGDGVRILDDWIGEEVRIHRCGRLALGSLRMKGRNGLIGSRLSLVCRLLRTGSSVLRQERKARRRGEENCSAA